MIHTRCFMHKLRLSWVVNLITFMAYFDFEASIMQNPSQHCVTFSNTKTNKNKNEDAIHIKMKTGRRKKRIKKM